MRSGFTTVAYGLVYLYKVVISLITCDVHWVEEAPTFIAHHFYWYIEVSSSISPTIIQLLLFNCSQLFSDRVDVNGEKSRWFEKVSLIFYAG